jgi:hypothetical protein
MLCCCIKWGIGFVLYFVAMDIIIRGIDPENVRDVDRCDGEFSIAQRVVPRVEAGKIVYRVEKNH